MKNIIAKIKVLNMYSDVFLKITYIKALYLAAFHFLFLTNVILIHHEQEMNFQKTKFLKHFFNYFVF